MSIIMCPTDPVTCLSAGQTVEIITDKNERIEERISSQTFSEDIKALCLKYNIKTVGIHSNTYFEQLKNNITKLYSGIEVIKI